MFDDLTITRMSQSLARHAGSRLGLIARNVAQANTPGYKGVDLPDFAESYQDTQLHGMRATRAGHQTARAQMMEPVAQSSGGEMSPDGNNVSLAREMVKSVDVRQQHDMAIAIYRNTSEIIRTSLGRR